MIQVRYKTFFVAVVCLLLSAQQLSAMPDIQVQGLFSGKAMLSIDGKVQLLRDGETSPEGVTLVVADSKQATIEYQGSLHSVALSDRIGASFAQPQRPEVRLQPDTRGHYLARANINGRYIDVMVDTGATLIALNSNHAAQLGIRFDNAQEGYSQTASGIVPTKLVVLDAVSIGGITRHSVAASVIEGDFPSIILLGNSFLSGVDMTIDSGVMVMQPKF